MPEVTVSLPAALGFLALFLTIGAVLVFFALRNSGRVVDEPTPTPTATVTATVTATATATSTGTPEPTWTPLPDITHKISTGETCISLAAFYGVSVNAIIQANNLSTACDNLVVGNELSIPQPTPTASPQPTSTLSGVESTDTACEKVDYTVQAGDTLMAIAANYNVTMEAIKEYNGLVNDVVFENTDLVIPLCERKTINGATPTPTAPPPYPAANLLLPMNGAAFADSEGSITLQWSSVGTLRPNEAYAVTVEDITFSADTGENRKIVEYVTENKFILPSTIRPTDNKPHLIYWSVLPVRQLGTSTDGTPIWQPAGSVSETRGLIWSGGGGSGSPAPTTTP